MLSRIKRFVSEDHFLKHMYHYNYLQLITINTNWELFTKDIKSCKLNQLGMGLRRRFLKLIKLKKSTLRHFVEMCDSKSLFPLIRKTQNIFLYTKWLTNRHTNLETKHSYISVSMILSPLTAHRHESAKPWENLKFVCPTFQL